ncbi:hypothetical protein LC1Hm_1016 [Halomicrobium sp. LC1Hm]|nr:hypothetical protein LC1Hm_1016 [Halomicrobium sp. LC1Hm]
MLVVIYYILYCIAVLVVLRSWLNTILPLEAFYQLNGSLMYPSSRRITRKGDSKNKK